MRYMSVSSVSRLVVGMIFVAVSYGCARKPAEEPISTDQPALDLPVAPAASVAPEPPMNVGTFDVNSEVEKPAKKRSAYKPAKKNRTKPKKK